MAELLVKDIMTRELKSILYDKSIKEAAEKMTDEKIPFLLVIDEKDNPIGIVTRKDIAFRVMRKSKNPEDILVSAVMSSPIATVSENLNVRNFGKLLGEKGYKRLLVEREGILVGAASNTDILKAVANNQI